MVRVAIDGDGTTEASWRPWLARVAWAPLDLDRLIRRRVVVLAAHPDDEVLGAGGLLRRLADAGGEVVFVWATDGDASHPASTVFSRSELAARRREEARVALDRLGMGTVRGIHLGLPDGEVERHADDLRQALRRVVGHDDLLIAPWRGDGHPDHEAVGRVAAMLDQPLIEYPIWMWHWAQPGDRRVPWHRVREVAAIDVAAKAAAIDAFTTQIHPIGPDPADAAILPSHVLDRFRRTTELVFQ